MNNWISIKDKLPDNDGAWVLVYADGAMNCMGFYRGKWQFWVGESPSHNIDIKFITHWMLLPEPPKEEDSDKQGNDQDSPGSD